MRTTFLIALAVVGLSAGAYAAHGSLGAAPTTTGHAPAGRVAVQATLGPLTQPTPTAAPLTPLTPAPGQLTEAQVLAVGRDHLMDFGSQGPATVTNIQAVYLPIYEIETNYHVSEFERTTAPAAWLITYVGLSMAVPGEHPGDPGTMSKNGYLLIDPNNGSFIDEWY